MPAVEAVDLTLAYGSRTVLSGVSLSFGTDAGVIGLAGPNGSGKSTFLKACLGLLPVRGGTLRLFGEQPGSRAFRDKLRLVGWAPQQKAPGALRLSVSELVGLVTTDQDAVEEALETAGIADLAHRPTQELSGGQLQRASIARALAGKPRLLLLDEPTTHLDRDSRRSVIALLEKLAGEHHVAMVMVSHDAEALSLCDRYFAFADGQVREARREELELDLE